MRRCALLKNNQISRNDEIFFGVNLMKAYLRIVVASRGNIAWPIYYPPLSLHNIVLPHVDRSLCVRKISGWEIRFSKVTFCHLRNISEWSRFLAERRRSKTGNLSRVVLSFSFFPHFRRFSRLSHVRARVLEETSAFPTIFPFQPCAIDRPCDSQVLWSCLSSTRFPSCFCVMPHSFREFSSVRTLTLRSQNISV